MVDISPEEIISSKDSTAFQFYWQGYDAYVKCIDKENAAGCFYKANCDFGNDEYIQFVPVESQQSSALTNQLKVHLICAAQNKYLRATRVSKYLKWSRNCDDQSVFRIQTLNHQPMTTSSQFIIASCFWKDYYVGFTPTVPLGTGKDMKNAVGCLTLEKKKQQTTLVFPLRFRAVPRSSRATNNDEVVRRRMSIPAVTPAGITYVREEHIQPRVPLATVIFGATTEITVAESLIWENCPYCGMVFRDLDALQHHIEVGHQDIITRVSIRGAFCTICGRRRIRGQCARCHV
uniref:Uncharacterized protein AlNc14C74G5002 n=1 Tax=Albugo laibachii Nc14 TaxID=890382 RepID=F0WEE5_9STRA|nr:conserved hypothetical protein [Albugo laibachii Nc14]|eukprot:CCA19577.1 conserved hypothetical protein [Albugo laibachii Nc14]